MAVSPLFPRPLRRGGVLALALSCAAILSGVGQPVAAASEERCYGVSLAGENDGIGDREAPGTSTSDFQGNAWTYVEIGKCARLPLPPQSDGTPRRGALEPLARDPG